MAQPSAYNRAYNFANYQAENPNKPLPAAYVDEELSRVKATLDQIRQNLALIQRDDTALANGVVGQDQLSASLEIGVSPPTAWLTSTNYVSSRDTVFQSSVFYRCVTSHTSGTFATDLAAGYWEEIADFSALSSDAAHTAFTPAGDLASTTVQDALEELDTEKAAASAVTLALAAKLDLDGSDTMTGDLDMGSNKVTGLADGTADTDGVSKGQLDASFVTDAFALKDDADQTKLADFDLSNITTATTRTITVPDEDVSLVNGNFGQCQLVISGANLALNRFNGRFLMINGAIETIPSTAPTLATTSLSNTTLYYIYAYMSSGTMTLEASTTARATDSTTGIQIKSGDATRTLVGMGYIVSGSWSLVRSWFNRKQFASYSYLSSSATTTATSPAEVSSSLNISFLIWSDETALCAVSGGVSSNTSGASAYTFVGVDGTFQRPFTLSGTNASNVNVTNTFSAQTVLSLSEGYHYATLMGQLSSAATASFIAGSGVMVKVG